MTEEVAVVAISVAKPGNEARLRTALEALIAPTLQEPGALQYELHADVAEPRRFVFVERWASKAALAAHAKSAHIAAFGKLVSELVEHSKIHVLKKLA